MQLGRAAISHSGPNSSPARGDFSLPPLIQSLQLTAPPCCAAPLVPLIGFISVGLGSAVLYLLRLALYSPDVSWDRKNNPEPWNKLGPTDQYKFIAVSTDYKNLKKERPSF
ncbi:NADH dehydrogenase [ubiquinone] 1 alpha subcomplex subunit 4-like 2 isoform X2 [Coturnix japonica]|uniref:NADH dehydrogenase [ubiquinone] 1 alpha subcomplex subunit 4-like 2 isoform X2 n=1 Tax=Coturnix japonica TaxID=93934 RepID=UPI0007775A8A|nr:NADH dehydrogenase [ubiquinone] 1 alpha subcomplex subunit 4-like 2 isoform X2 [Coturnix japonica]